MKSVRQFVFLALLGSVFSGPALAADYEVDYAVSKVMFTGEHAGDKFEGAFGKWETQISFDPADLAASQIKAEFEVESAKTGNKMYDGTLPSKDWFDAKEFPKAVFESKEITKKDDGSYHAEGIMILRGAERPLGFDFTLSDLTVSPVQVKASFPLDRAQFGIGQESDPNGEWVSKEITITLDVQAKPLSAAE